MKLIPIPPELTERAYDVLGDLLAAIEAHYHEAGVEYMDEEDRAAVLQGRWLMATINGDADYLAEHGWSRAQAGDPELDEPVEWSACAECGHTHYDAAERAYAIPCGSVSGVPECGCQGQE
jgi:hypothetical protein